MDGFGDSFVPAAEGAAPPAEVDPAAEFLAREQDQLAGLEDDLAAVTVSAAPDSTATSVIASELECEVLGLSKGSKCETLEELLDGKEITQSKLLPPGKVIAQPQIDVDQTQFEQPHLGEIIAQPQLDIAQNKQKAPGDDDNAQFQNVGVKLRETDEPRLESAFEDINISLVSAENTKITDKHNLLEADSSASSIVGGLGGGDSGDLFGSTPAVADAPVIVNGTADLESFEMLGGDEILPELSGAPAAASELLGGGEGLGEGDFGSSEVTAADDFLGEALAAPMVADEGLGVDYSALSMVGASDAAQEPIVAESIEQQQQPAVPASTTPVRSVTPIPIVREEPEKIKIWREEQLKRMEEKDKLEEEAKEELRLKAKGELEEWYKQHEEQVAKTRQANRSAEKELVAETCAIEPGTEWERISKLCDFNPKTAKSTRDISRMRSIILQVKQNPPVKA